MSAKTLRLILAVLLLAFLFAGTPDVWDALHAITMDALSAKAAP